MDRYNRPNWDSYFMALAFVASQRSLDPSTKHGCVITNRDHCILSIGYNGPPRGANEDKIPLTRPEKYHFMAHAEANAIDNCNTNLKDAVVYVTGVPCAACLLRLIQRGIGTIVYGLVGSNCCDDVDAMKSMEILAAMGPKVPIIIRYESNEYANILRNTLEYAASKCENVESPPKPPIKPKKLNWFKRIIAKIDSISGDRESSSPLG